MAAVNMLMFKQRELTQVVFPDDPSLNRIAKPTIQLSFDQQLDLAPKAEISDL